MVKSLNEHLSLYIFVITLILVTALLYFQSLYYPHVYDSDILFQNGFYKSMLDGFSPFDLRWCARLSFCLIYKISGTDLFWHRFSNILIHLGNVVLIFVFCRKLFFLTLNSNHAHKEAYYTLLAFFAALVFSLSPVSVYATAYLIQRFVLMATFFGLLFLLSFLKGLLSEKKRWFFLSVVMYFLSIHSKEHAIMFPLVALVLSVLLRKHFFKDLKRLWWVFVLLILIGLELVVRTQGILGMVYEPHAQFILSGDSLALVRFGMMHILSIVNQGFLFFKYLLLWMLPNTAWMSFDLQSVFPSSIFSWPQILGFAFFCIYPFVGITLVLCRGRRGLCGFALLYPWILFLTELSVVRYSENFLLYRSYLWMSCFFSFIPILTCFFTKKILFLVLSGTCLVFSVIMQDRLVTFKTALSVWQDAANKLPLDASNIPASFRVYDLVGDYLKRAGRYEEAKPYLKRSLELKPNYVFANQNMAEVFEALGSLDEAQQHYFKAILLRYGEEDMPGAQLDMSDTLIRLGKIYLQRGLYQKAIPYFTKAAELNPNSARAQYNLGHSWIRLNRLNQALKAYETVIKINPENINVYYNIGVVYYKKKENFKAAENFKKVPFGNTEYEQAQQALKIMGFE